MKKLFILASILLVSSISGHSQEAFKHLSVGLDLGTTGIGLELAYPIVSDHLVLVAGYNFGNSNFKVNNDVDLSAFSSTVNNYVDKANNYLKQIGEAKSLTSMPDNTNMDIQAGVKLGSVKAMLEYYPAKKSSFHINLGVYIGSETVLSTNATASQMWNLYSNNVSVAKEMSDKYPQYASQVGTIPELKASINGKTYQIKEPGAVNADLHVAKVRPYLGLGFGRSIPDSHFAFQFDFGAIYTGKFSVSSLNETTGAASVVIDNKELNNAIEMIGKVCFYPQLSFRLIYRIF